MKERLVGAAVLVALAVIFIPMLLDKSPSGPGPITDSNIPEQPDNGFRSNIVPVQPEPATVELPEPPDTETTPATPSAEPVEPAPETASEPAPATSAEEATPAGDGEPAETTTAARATETDVPSTKADAQAAAEPDISGDMSEPTGDKPSETSGWVIQLGSFSKEDNAHDLNQKLRAGGYSSFVETIKRGGDTIYRVRVGPQVLRDDAKNVRDRIAGEFDIKGIVLSYP